MNRIKSLFLKMKNFKTRNVYWDDHRIKNTIDDIKQRNIVIIVPKRIFWGCFGVFISFGLGISVYLLYRYIIFKFTEGLIAAIVK